MENTFYIKKEASELPPTAGSYHTNKGLVVYRHDHKQWSFGPIEYWLQPTSTKGMTLDEAKEQYAQSYGYKTWADMYSNDDISNIIINETAELFLASNTIKLMEQLQEKDLIIYGIEEGADEWRRRYENESHKVTVLKEALELLKSAVDLLVDLGHVGHNDIEIYRQKIADLQSITK